MDKPLSIVISSIIYDNKILLIKRIKGSYIGFWGLPGGKIKKNEHLSDAAVREVFEEAGIESKFKNYLGLVSEHEIEENKVLNHFLLHICELRPKSSEIKQGLEGKLEWFDLNSLENVKNSIIPSDYHIIEKIIKNKESIAYNCVLEKKGDEYELIMFNKIS